MKTAILTLCIVPWLLTGCGVLRTAGNIVGLDASPPSTLNSAVPTNEYSAACQRKRGDMILQILGEKGDAQ